MIKGDILEIDWKDADIVYNASTCFPGQLNENIGRLCEKLKSGSRIVTLKAFKHEVPFLEVIAEVKIKMSWGSEKTTIYIRK